MPFGRDSRTCSWACGGGPVVGTMMVAETWWRWWSSSANAASGMRWPIPGLGRIAMWGV